MSASRGLRLALTTFTVLPVAGLNRPQRTDAAWAMRLAPLAGALLGMVLAGLLVVLRWLDLPALLTGALLVGAAALLTRGMHLDGLADTVDALGSYRDRERALQIMRAPEVGPFGVVALVLVLLTQAGAIAVLTPLGVVVALSAGRLAAPLACRHGIPAARPDGLGALVAGTVGPWSVPVSALTIAAGGLWAVPGRPWAGPLAIAASLAVALLLRRHGVRRFGGTTGDLVGFLIECGTTVALVMLAIHSGVTN